MFDRFSPDGKTIAYISDKFEFWNLWLCDSDGSNARRVFESGDVCYAPWVCLASLISLFLLSFLFFLSLSLSPFFTSLFAIS
jgi:hypothetical protein